MENTIGLSFNNLERTNYCHKSDNDMGLKEILPRRGPNISVDDRFRDIKFSLIEMYGRGISLSTKLKQGKLFKNRKQSLNGFLSKNEKSRYTLKSKEGDFINCWELVIWSKDEIKKQIKTNYGDDGSVTVYYFSEEPMEEILTKDNLPSFSCSTSKIAIDILVDKKDFNEIKKAILKGRNETKQKEYFFGNLTNVESFDISKIEFKIDIKKPGAVYANVGKIARIFAIKDFKFIKELKYKKGKKS